jgi:outer membrane protein OmpA-like peptidoglycan-associated protein
MDLRRAAQAVVATFLVANTAQAAGTWIGGGVSGGVGLLFGKPQIDFYAPVGYSAGARFGFAPTPWLAPELYASLEGFAAKTGLGTGTLVTVGAGARLLPLPSLKLGMLYADVHGGLALTGPLSRFNFDVGVGFELAAGPVMVGPFARYVRVFSAAGADELAGDASLLILGVSVGFVSRAAEPVVTQLPAPEDDYDGDGLVGVNDACPRRAEDKDGFEDGDGCPDVDDDEDGIVDAKDKCPREAETLNGTDDADGCPDESAEKAVISKNRKQIEIRDRIYFALNEATILPSSNDVLASVARLMEKFPAIKRLRVEGHTDDRGGDDVNQSLSERRAGAVRAYLIRLGVDAARLTSKGYGKSKPLIDERTEEARNTNRRVEFVLEEPATLEFDDVVPAETRGTP